MFWIIGGEGIAHAAAELSGWAWLVWLAGQLEHPEWHGFKFYDLIFPLFLFLAGVSMPLSFEKRLARGDTKAQVTRHVIVRGLVLVLLGMIYNGLLEFDWPNTRLPSVLGRIGLAYLFAGLIVLNTNWRGQLIWIAGLLVGYWAALKFIPVPGFGAGDLEPGKTLTDFIDRLLIPGQLYQGDRDPEGLFGTIPAIGTALAGALTGQFLKNENHTGYFKAAAMALVGVACLGLAQSLEPQLSDQQEFVVEFLRSALCGLEPVVPGLVLSGDRCLAISPLGFFLRRDRHEFHLDLLSDQLRRLRAHHAFLFRWGTETHGRVQTALVVDCGGDGGVAVALHAVPQEDLSARVKPRMRLIAFSLLTLAQKNVARWHCTIRSTLPRLQRGHGWPARSYTRSSSCYPPSVLREKLHLLPT